MTVRRLVERGTLRSLAVEDGCRLVTVTAYWRENWGESMRRIARAIRDIASAHRQDVLVLPLHPKPAVLANVLPTVAGLDDVIVTSPLPHERFAHIMAHSDTMLSGTPGVQEKAPSLGGSILALCNATERPEAIEAGTARLVGPDPQCIVEEASRSLDDLLANAAMTSVANHHGDGQATQRIVAAPSSPFGIDVRPPDFASRKGLQ